jgi:hypothetical protein
VKTHETRTKAADPPLGTSLRADQITLDLSFADAASFERHAKSPALSAEAIGAMYGIDPALVKHFIVPELCVLKISYPRRVPQGGAVERDMHGGQQYVRLLDVEL